MLTFSTEEGAVLNVDQYKAQLEKLSREERADLAHFLLRSLELEKQGSGATRNAEISRHEAELRSGRGNGEPVEPLAALLDRIAAELRDAPALSNEAVSRAGIYTDHP